MGNKLNTPKSQLFLVTLPLAEHGISLDCRVAASSAQNAQTIHMSSVDSIRISKATKKKTITSDKNNGLRHQFQISHYIPVKCRLHCSHSFALFPPPSTMKRFRKVFARFLFPRSRPLQFNNSIPEKIPLKKMFRLLRNVSSIQSQCLSLLSPTRANLSGLPS